MIKIVFIFRMLIIVLIGCVLSFCEDYTPIDYEAELLDVRYGNGNNDSTCLSICEDSMSCQFLCEYIDLCTLYRYYFQEYSTLFIKFEGIDTSINSIFLLNKYADKHNSESYKIFIIEDNDTLPRWSKVDSLNYESNGCLFCESPYKDSDYNQHSYFTMRVEDVSDIQHGLICVRVLHPISFNLDEERSKTIDNLGNHGICFEIINGRFVKGKFKGMKSGLGDHSFYWRN